MSIVEQLKGKRFLEIQRWKYLGIKIAEVIWLHHGMLFKIWWFNGSTFVNFVEKNNNTIGITT
jgi:hypothetical protein